MQLYLCLRHPLNIPNYDFLFVLEQAMVAIANQMQCDIFTQHFL